MKIVGEKFGRLRALKEIGPDRYWCRCSCGKELEVWRSSLRRGVAKHCGCRLKYPNRQSTQRFFLHIRYYEGRDGKRHLVASGEFNSWMAMKNRCLYKTTVSYADYGGRGIRICARWIVPRGIGFQNFLGDMGPRPLGKTLDRIECQAHYEPHNCRWADCEMQNQNRRYLLYPDGNEPPVVKPSRDIMETEAELAGCF